MSPCRMHQLAAQVATARGCLATLRAERDDAGSRFDAFLLDHPDPETVRRCKADIMRQYTAATRRWTHHLNALYEEIEALGMMAQLPGLQVDSTPPISIPVMILEIR